MIKNEIKLFSMSAGAYENISCTAPCSLCSVLLDGGYIDDPLYGENIKSVGSILPKSCTFSANVEISGDALLKKHVYIRLCGIYANAEIFFNGRSYGMAYDPNRVYLFDVTDRVKSSDNKLEVSCLEPLPRRRLIENDGAVSDKYAMPPYLGDMGIIGKCEVIFTSRGFIGDVSVKQTHKEGSAELSIGADILGVTGDVRAVATLVSPSGKLFYGSMSGGECRITVSSPEYWMPNGLGKPLLYKLSLTLYEGDEASDTYERRIGLREITESWGENGEPELLIGGIKVFPLGASYVTSDPILSRITKSSAEALIKNAVSSGMNTLRVVDGGVCPPEFFYDLCDKYGVMVYQDIAVPYIHSLATSRRAQSTADAVLDVLAKISAHPCVVSAELSLLETVGQGKPSSRAEVDEFFDVLMRLISEKKNKYIHGMRFIERAEVLEKYDERHASENTLSLIALPSESSLESFIPREDMNLLSPSMEIHGLTEASAGKMLWEMVGVSRFPSGISDTVYVSNLTAAYLFADSVKHARSQSGDNKKAFSAICRQLNDGWPSVTSSFVDWYGEEKAISYAARDVYAPITVYARFEGASARLHVINSSRKNYEGKLMIALYTASDKCLFESVRDVNVPAGVSISAAEEDFSRFMKEGPESLYLIYELSDINGVTSSGFRTPLPLKSMRLCDPKVEAQIEGSGKNFSLKLTAAAFAPHVRVSFDGLSAKFSRNFVSTASYAPVMIRIETETNAACEELMSKLRINTFYNLGK